MTLFDRSEGNTLLTPDEEDDLIPSLATRGELNEWERLNLLSAFRWALTARNRRIVKMLTEPYLRDLHRRMFDQTWKWAGLYRTTEKNLGVPHYQIREAIAVLLGDARCWIDYKSYLPDEIAIRFHHRLVCIHPFANGNGRHSRLMADVLAIALGRSAFTWGRLAAVSVPEVRRRYLDALQAADRHDIEPLVRFSRS